MSGSRIAKLVTFGRGGDTVYYSHGVTGSGYGTPESPHAADPATLEIPDGTPVIDNRAAVLTDSGYAWVFRGPMVDVDLPCGTVDPCPTPSALFASAVQGNAYGTLLNLHAAHKVVSPAPGPLDAVDIQTYVNGWREHGARIGQYHNGVIEWEGR